MPRYIVDLNNYLQKQGQLAALYWGEEQVGQPGRFEWKMTCYINNEARGVGIAAQKNSAKEDAAKQALTNLGQLAG